MKKYTERFVSPEQQDRIVEAVTSAEKRTSGEIVPMIVNDSYDYRYAFARGALFFTLLASLATAALIMFKIIPSFACYWLLAGQTVIYLISWWFVRLSPWIVRLFIRRDEVDEEVAEGAFTAFYKQGVNNTRDRTGILLYISLFEKKVWVLADSGINEKVDPDAWRNIADTITNGIKNKKGPDAICVAVGMCADLLEKNFPRKPDDENELNDIIIEYTKK